MSGGITLADGSRASINLIAEPLNGSVTLTVRCSHSNNLVAQINLPFADAQALSEKMIEVTKRLANGVKFLAEAK